jgi:hypothetical protein
MMAYAIPGFEEYPFALAVVETLRSITPGRQRLGLVKAAMDAVIVTRIEDIFRLKHVLHGFSSLVAHGCVGSLLLRAPPDACQQRVLG